MKPVLDILDCFILVGVLLISAGTGIYFCIVAKEQSSRDFLLAGQNMPILPVSLSLMSTFMSSTTLLGIPADIYLNGTPMAFMNLGFIIGPTIMAYFMLPIYYTNKFSTVSEYIQVRYGKFMSKLVSGTYSMQYILFASISIYAPALALNAVTNLPDWLSIISIGSVCSICCALGGMKAVLWADAFQSLLMYVCLFSVIVMGSIEVGSLASVFDVSQQGGRLLLPKWDFGAQYSMMNVILYSIIITASCYGCSPIQVQRLMTLKNIAHSRIAVFLSIPLNVTFHLLCCLSGLVIYACFHSCDPLTSENEDIRSPDQLLPYYAARRMSGVPGLLGLCVSGIFSSSLSTVSSLLNTLAVVTTQDFFPTLGSNNLLLLTRLASIFYGVISIALCYALASMGNLVKLMVLVIGLFAGPNLAVFLLATITTTANERGAVVGLLSGICVGIVMLFLPQDHIEPNLPTSTRCFANETASQISETYSAFFNETVNNKQNRTHNRISYMWISPAAFLVTLLVGYVCSKLVTLIKGETAQISLKHLSPFRRFIINSIGRDKNKDAPENETKLNEKFLTEEVNFYSDAINMQYSKL